MSSADLDRSLLDSLDVVSVLPLPGALGALDSPVTSRRERYVAALTLLRRRNRWGRPVTRPGPEAAALVEDVVSYERLYLTLLGSERSASPRQELLDLRLDRVDGDRAAT